MLFVKLNGINYRFGNLIKIILSVISANLLLYKHNKICIKEVKNAQKTKLLSELPDYYIFNEFTIDDEIIESDFFNYCDYFYAFKPNEFDNLIDKYLKAYINYDIKLNNIYNLDFNNDLFIHIRSGDIFEKNNYVNDDVNSDLFKWFIQPPYSFYEKIINENINKKIYILSENINNPIIEKIMNNFENCKFLSNEIETDFQILLNSKYLVSSTSDFVLTAVFLSNYKNIIYASRENYYYLVSHKFNIKYYDYSEYYNTKINSYDEKLYLMLNS